MALPQITFPISTGNKEDHPERVARLATVDPKYFYTAEELKLYENAINALAELFGNAATADFINNGSNGLSRFVELSELITLLPSVIGDSDTALFSGDVLWKSGLDFFAFADWFKIDGNEIKTYYSLQITLNALGNENPTFKRTDIFAIEFNGVDTYNLIVIEGTPDPVGTAPTLNASTQLEISRYTISAGATEPDNVNKNVIYAEGIAEEWNVTTDEPVKIIINSPSVPIAGSKSILCEGPSQDKSIFFTSNIPVFTSSETILVFDLKLETIWEWKSSNRITIDIYLKSGNTTFAGRVRIGSDFGYNFDGNNTADTQQIIVRLSRLPGIYDKNSFDGIQFKFKRTENEIFRIDNVQLVEGVENNNVQNIPRKVSELFNDLFFQTKDEVQAKNATLHKSTATINTLLLEQSTQLVNELIEVQDASDDNLVNSGIAIYKYKGTTNGNLTDYQLQYKQESLVSNLKTISDAWNIGGMNVRAYATNYPILINTYTALPVNLPIDTLSESDISNGFSRKDAVVATTYGTIIVLKGTPGLIAFSPFIDTDLYYFIRDVLIIPGATEPVDPATETPNTTDLILFAEVGTEVGGESTVTATSGTVTIAADSTITGTKCIRGLNVPRTGIYSKFSFATAKEFANFTALNFDYKSDTIIASIYFTVNIYNGTQLVGTKTIFNGNNGYISTSSATQNINVPKAEFNTTGLSYTHIEIRPRSYSASVINLNYRIDNVKLINGFTTNPNNPIDISGKEDKSNKGIAGGYVPLNTSSKIDKTYLYDADPSQITITTTVSITTDTLGDLGKTQKEKNVIINNGVNAINITVNGGTNFLASYLKHGTGTITFVQGSGRTLIQVDATAVLNGAVGSTATISSIGTTDYLRISNS